MTTRGAEPHTKGVGRICKVRSVGLDVHAQTVTVAVDEPNGEVRSVGVSPNRSESARKIVLALGPVQQLRVALGREALASSGLLLPKLTPDSKFSRPLDC